jgi:hypothetical protein
MVDPNLPEISPLLAAAEIAPLDALSNSIAAGAAIFFESQMPTKTQSVLIAERAPAFMLNSTAFS